MGRRLSMASPALRDSHILEDPKEISIDSNLIDVIYKIEDSTFEMKHKKAHKMNLGTLSHLGDEFDSFLRKKQSKR